MPRNVSYLADTTIPGLCESEVTRIAAEQEEPRALRGVDRRVLRDLGLDRSAS